jgi:hypothetical protein
MTEVKKTKLRKIVTRAMDDVRGLDERYPDPEDSKALADTLNGILEDALDKIIQLTDGNS